jgi:hypothetical protein
MAVKHFICTAGKTTTNAVFWVWRRAVLVRTDVLKESAASIFRVEGISELEITLAVTRKTTEVASYC